MKYYINKIIETDFDSAIAKVTEALKKEGFGVISDIDIQGKLKEKLNVDFRRYRILGACNPPIAFQALTHEDKIGTMLPCNVIVQEIGDNKIEIAAVDPIASMQAIENEKLGPIALQVKSSLESVIKSL
jgi:uncharacterized protein (DUF302 family)